MRSACEVLLSVLLAGTIGACSARTDGPVVSASSSGGLRRSSVTVGPDDRFPHTLPLSVRLSSRCARPGEDLQVTAVTAAQARISFAVTYPGMRTDSDLMDVDPTRNTTGTYTWRLRVRSFDDPAQAYLLVAVVKGDKRATANVVFKIANSCA